MSVITVPLKPVASIKLPSLGTLAAIQRYVAPNPFTPKGLARGLGRTDQNALFAQLTWLVKQGYVERTSLESLRLTLKGKMFDGDYPDDGGGFEIEFLTAADPEAMQPEENPHESANPRVMPRGSSYASLNFPF